MFVASNDSKLRFANINESRKVTKANMFLSKPLTLHLTLI